MKRVMCVWLPGWAIQRCRRERPELSRQPLVLYASGERRGASPKSSPKMLVTACSTSALKEGVRPGMLLAEARALGTTVHFEPHDLQADREALRQLALWCQQFSPIVALEEATQPDSLLVDITGCSHLFGGEESLCTKVLEAFRGRGLWTSVAIADTIGAAWAIAHYPEENTEDRICPPHEHAEALRSLPVEALRLPGPVLQLLHQFDIQRIGQLLALPRSSLPARFGREVMLRLDQALGDVTELVGAEQAPEPVEASWAFDPPTADRRIIETVLQQLLEQVLQRLQSRPWGIRQLSCTLKTVDERQPFHFEVGLLQPSVSVRHLMELLRLQLERGAGSDRSASAEISAIILRVAVALPLEFRQGQLFEKDASSDRWRQLPTLIERLSNRLGEKSILRPRLWPDAQPEFACRYEPWLTKIPSTKHQTPNTKHKSKLRPPCLICRPAAIPGAPRQFHWQGRHHHIVHCWGPERIETGWWRGQDVCRDYYLVETTAGQRFWIFQTSRGSWFLHGIFA